MPVDPEIKVEFINNYLRYFRAGYRAGVKTLNSAALKGMQLLVAGNVPVAAGLSSSAAFTVCSALVGLHANGGDKGPYVEGSRE
jgi:galactokinase